MKILVQFLMIILTVGCNEQNHEIKEIIKQWQNKQIYFPEHLETKIYGRDTLFQNLLSSRYKIINYIDTAGCTSCRLKFFDWKLLIVEAQRLNMDVSFLFLIYSNDYNKIEYLQKENKLDYPIIYDRNDSVNYLNNFPRNLKYQTFLLNEQNEVILIGSPVRNKKLWTLYKSIILGI